LFPYTTRFRSNRLRHVRGAIRLARKREGSFAFEAQTGCTAKCGGSFASDAQLGRPAGLVGATPRSYARALASLLDEHASILATLAASSGETASALRETC